MVKENDIQNKLSDITIDKGSLWIRASVTVIFPAGFSGLKCGANSALFSGEHTVTPENYVRFSEENSASLFPQPLVHPLL